MLYFARADAVLALRLNCRNIYESILKLYVDLNDKPISKLVAKRFSQ